MHLHSSVWLSANLLSALNIFQVCWWCNSIWDIIVAVSAQDKRVAWACKETWRRSSNTTKTNPNRLGLLENILHHCILKQIAKEFAEGKTWGVMVRDDQDTTRGSSDGTEIETRFLWPIYLMGSMSQNNLYLKNLWCATHQILCLPTWITMIKFSAL